MKGKIMLLIICYILSTVIGLIFIKMGGSNLSLNIKNQIFNFSIGMKSLLGFCFYILSFFLWMLILSKSDTKLSIIFPVVRVIIQTLVIISGILIFKEKINIVQFLGIFLAILGIVLIVYAKN